jgi:hypothetical protein
MMPFGVCSKFAILRSSSVSAQARGWGSPPATRGRTPSWGRRSRRLARRTVARYAYSRGTAAADPRLRHASAQSYPCVRAAGACRTCIHAHHVFRCGPAPRQQPVQCGPSRLGRRHSPSAPRASQSQGRSPARRVARSKRWRAGCRRDRAVPDIAGAVRREGE